MADETTTLTDDEITTKPVGYSIPQASTDDADAGDTGGGDDSGDTGDTSDTSDSGDTSDTGDDSAA